MSHRTRLNDDERLYLISLVEKDNNLNDNQAKDALVGKPIKRLLAKLGDTRYHSEKLREVEFKPVACEHCDRLFKSGAGLSRHMASAHKAQLTPQAEQPHNSKERTQHHEN